MAVIRLLFYVFCFWFSTMTNALDWKIIPEKSKLIFQATQNNAPVTGEFKSFTSDIDFDPEKLSDSYVEVIVDIESVSATLNDIALTLKSIDWFDAKKFPKAIFVADHFKKTGKNTYDALGKLTLRDQTQPIALHFTLEKYDRSEAIATGTATLKRTDFHVGQGEWSSTHEIKDEVVIRFMIEATSKNHTNH